jgi:HlyD family secretion protein
VSSTRFGRRFLVVLGVAAIIGIVGLLAVRRAGARNDRAAAIAAPARGVAALGHIEPEDGVVVVAARSLTGQPSILAELKVKEGDLVRAGDLVGVLNSRDQLEAAWREADARVVLAKKQLAQIEAGARPGDLEAQRAEVARAEAELANAETEYARFERLYQSQAAAQAELDARRTRLDTARQAVRQAKARLGSLAEIRTTDVDAARAAVAAAAAAANRARAEYEPSVIRAPIGGRVLTIHAWPGEEIGPKGVLELAKTDRMYAIAEVAESDLARVKVGDRAIVTGDALAEPLDGVVEHIGWKVAQSQVLATDPAAFVDARTVDVKVRLGDATRAERLIHAQVRVVTRP